MKRHNIFHTVLKSNLPAPEKLPKRLGQEGFVAIAAGGETCGRMLTNGVYYTIANKERVWSQLKEELWQVMPTLEVQPDLKALEQLPYLVLLQTHSLSMKTDKGVLDCNHQRDSSPERTADIAITACCAIPSPELQGLRYSTGESRLHVDTGYLAQSGHFPRTVRVPSRALAGQQPGS